MRHAGRENRLRSQAIELVAVEPSATQLKVCESCPAPKPPPSCGGQSNWKTTLRVSLVGLGLLGGNLPSLMPAVVEPTAGSAGYGSDRRQDAGGRLGDRPAETIWTVKD